MGNFSICLFGRFHAQHNGRTLGNLDTNKAQELLCYLLLNRNHPHHREVLASALWSDNPTAQSKKYLRQALWQLQTVLHSDNGIDQKNLLIIEPDWITFNTHADFWLDVQEFEQAMGQVRESSGEVLETEQVQSLENAIQLYRGNLLEGWYQDWCLYERERLQNAYLDILDILMTHYAACHQYKAGLECGVKILQLDHARERTHWQMMRIHYLAGDRTGALRQFQECMAALGQELSVRPSQRTMALYEQIRADCSIDPHLSASIPSSPVYDAPSSLLERLKRLRSTLNDVQQQLDQDLQALEDSSTRSR